MNVKESFVERYWDVFKLVMITVTSITAFLFIMAGSTGILATGIMAATCNLIYKDARNRGLSKPKSYICAFGIFMILLIFLPSWLGAILKICL